MPTPVVHIYIAQQVLAAGNGAAPLQALRQQAGYFLLGSIAPDAWSVSQITRRRSHLLPIPIPAGRRGDAELLATYPQLERAEQLPPAQAAFVAGYMAHLLSDEIWYYRIFEPFFQREAAGDPPLPRRLLLHTALRLHCEAELARRLEPSLADALAGAAAPYNFPVFSDADLQFWRDRISAEIRPGAPKRSAEVFAQRLGVPVEEMTGLLESSDALRNQVLSRLPAGQLDQVTEVSIAQALKMIADYLGGPAAGART